MTRRQRRFALIAGSLAVLAAAVGLVLYALNDSIVFFHSPTELAEKSIQPGTRLRIGGLVAPGTVGKGENLAVRFEVTDGNKTIAVVYAGVLPDLFREGQGVIAEGVIERPGLFKADGVLAKHDENYMPREVADALKKQGHWQSDYTTKPQTPGAAGAAAGAAQ